MVVIIKIIEIIDELGYLEGDKKVNKVKLMREHDEWRLQEAINDFIRDKKIINISYSIAPCGYGYTYACCIFYHD